MPYLQHLSGLEEAVLRNIEAVGELSEIVRTSFGPNGTWPFIELFEPPSLLLHRALREPFSLFSRGELVETARSEGRSGRPERDIDLVFFFLCDAGKNKLIINHLGRLFVTSDAATIIREIEVIHPAAKLLVGASQAQEAEHGDNTNFVLIFAGELLKRAVNLLVMGMHPSEVVLGFEMASEKAREELESESDFFSLVRALSWPEGRWSCYSSRARLIR